MGITLKELMKIPPHEIRWMLINIIEDEKDNIEDFKQKYEALKPYMDINLFIAEQKKSKEKTIVSDKFDDVLLKHMYNDTKIIEGTKEQQQEREAKIKEIIGDNF